MHIIASVARDRGEVVTKAAGFAEAFDMSAEPAPSAKPLLLLNVDGVINDLEAVMKVRPLGDEAEVRARHLGIDLIRSHGFWVAIPDSMPELIQELTAQCDTWWCSTWADHANDEIAQHLGVGPFPVAQDCAASPRPLIERARAEDRAVVWIQDFNGQYPDVDGVTFVDTGEHGVLRWSDIPDELLQPAA